MMMMMMMMITARCDVHCWSRWRVSENQRKEKPVISYYAAHVQQLLSYFALTLALQSLHQRVQLHTSVEGLMDLPTTRSPFAHVSETNYMYSTFDRLRTSMIRSDPFIVFSKHDNAVAYPATVGPSHLLDIRSKVKVTRSKHRCPSTLPNYTRN